MRPPRFLQPSSVCIEIRGSELRKLYEKRAEVVRARASRARSAPSLTVGSGSHVDVGLHRASSAFLCAELDRTADALAFMAEHIDADTKYELSEDDVERLVGPISPGGHFDPRVDGEEPPTSPGRPSRLRPV